MISVFIVRLTKEIYEAYLGGEELDGTTVSALGVQSLKLSNIGRSSDDQKIYYLKLLRAAEDTLSPWSRLYLQSLAPTNPHWARLVGYGLFSLSVKSTKKAYAPAVRTLIG
jgi:hypothetical protein